ncbi:MAG TPA: DUF3606 domain-containing protein [Kamptonema sp.]|nr:DUF3606 domain-containing protein [Kamptonema sp.]
MSDNKKIKGPIDQKRININEPYEVGYWTSKLDITDEGLKLGVKEVGDKVEDVIAWSKRIENQRFRHLKINKR